MAADLDLRTDVPSYRVFRDGGPDGGVGSIADHPHAGPMLVTDLRNPSLDGD